MLDSAPRQLKTVVEKNTVHKSRRTARESILDAIEEIQRTVRKNARSPIQVKLPDWFVKLEEEGQHIEHPEARKAFYRSLDAKILDDPEILEACV